MFSSMMPTRNDFFEALSAHAERTAAAAAAALRLMNGVGTMSKDDTAELIKEVDFNERSADELKDKFISMLHESFITPFNRDQMHTLVREMDKVADAIQDAANAVTMFNIKEVTPEARELASLGSDACMNLSSAMRLFHDKAAWPKVMEFCKKIDDVETKADKVLKRAVTKLFEEEGDTWRAMRLRELYYLLEDSLDRCEDVAKTVEEIIIENT